LKGKCGDCEYRDICGGCRNRSYAYTGDIYESDPACVYVPESLRKQ
jgi:radical SAM protein with 4Fe4S-binding SPASM domain